MIAIDRLVQDCVPTTNEHASCFLLDSSDHEINFQAYSLCSQHPSACFHNRTARSRSICTSNTQLLQHCDRRLSRRCTSAFRLEPTSFASGRSCHQPMPVPVVGEKLSKLCQHPHFGQHRHGPSLWHLQLLSWTNHFPFALRHSWPLFRRSFGSADKAALYF